MGKEAAGTGVREEGETKSGVRFRAKDISVLDMPVDVMLPHGKMPAGMESRFDNFDESDGCAAVSQTCGEGLGDIRSMLDEVLRCR